MRHCKLCAAALSLVMAIAASVALAAVADSGGSRVQFVAKQSEVPLTGRFAKFRADVDLDPAHPQGGRIKVVIDLASADAGGADANQLLRSKEFFDVASFPDATFEATSITAAPNGGFQAAGTFTLKGHRAGILVPFTARQQGATTWFEGSTSISRLAYHVGEGQWSDTGTLDDEVLIDFKLQVAR